MRYPKAVLVCHVLERNGKDVIYDAVETAFATIEEAVEYMDVHHNGWKAKNSEWRYVMLSPDQKGGSL